MSITVSGLTKVYGAQRAVDDISFEVKTGEVLGFLGPNGAGKSTTMKVITCFIPPTAGRVTLEGFDTQVQPREVRRRVGYLPENTPLYTDMPVIDYLELAATLQDLPKAEIPGRIRSMIDVCGLGPEKHKYIGELSKGYRQRVGLAQALIHDPPVLVLDEPTTGLDPNQIVEIRSLIKEVGQEKTVMLSSHILKEVEMTCDRILIINEGRLVADDSTEKLRRRFMGGERLFVRTKNGATAAVRQAFEALPSVLSVAPAAENGGGWYLDAKPDAAAEEDVFRCCVERDWVLTELTPVESSLEDVFRELTKETA